MRWGPGSLFQSMAAFLRNPEADQPWDEDVTAGDVIHVQDMKVRSRVMAQSTHYHNRACCPGGHYRDYYPSVLFLMQIIATHLEIWHLALLICLLQYIQVNWSHEFTKNWRNSHKIKAEPHHVHIFWDILVLCNIVILYAYYAAWVDSLWPSDALMASQNVVTLVQVMACCLMAPSHYLNQCWLIISEVLWHSPGGNFTGNV